MRIRGIMKVMAALLADFVLCYIGAGAVLAAIVTGGIFFYAWIGEAIAVFFLTRFVEGQEPERQSLHEILYATHPPVHKRLQRIEQYWSVPVHTGRE